MKDMGIVQGSAAQAKPIVIGKDTVYVHTDIKLLPADSTLEGESGGSDNYEYHEVQYDLEEYKSLYPEEYQKALDEGNTNY